MTDGFHPENILPSGPGDLSPEALRLEIANDKYAVFFSAGVLALTATVETVGVGPDLVSSVHESDTHAVVDDGLTTAFLVGMSVLCISNIRSYRKRWTQAKFNQRLNKIAEANGIDPLSS